MTQFLRTTSQATLYDSGLNSQQTLLQRPSYEQTRNVTPQVSNVLACTTTEAALPLGGVANPGFATFENLETNTASTTYISVGFTVTATFYEAMRLGPMQSGQIFLSPSRTWQAKTNSSTGNLKYNILEINT